jgi:hypothetical protein
MLYIGKQLLHHLIDIGIGLAEAQIGFHSLYFLDCLTMPVNKRNWRKQEEHLGRARAVQAFDDPNGNWRNKEGRPSAQARVYEWRQQHPEGRKADCHRETGLDPKTVRKWWDCPPPAVRFENGHITVRVSPSQELSDWLLDALHDGGQE